MVASNNVKINGKKAIIHRMTALIPLFLPGFMNLERVFFRRTGIPIPRLFYFFAEMSPLWKERRSSRWRVLGRNHRFACCVLRIHDRNVRKSGSSDFLLFLARVIVGEIIKFLVFHVVVYPPIEIWSRHNWWNFQWDSEYSINQRFISLDNRLGIYLVLHVDPVCYDRGMQVSNDLLQGVVNIHLFLVKSSDASSVLVIKAISRIKSDRRTICECVRSKRNVACPG